MQEAPLVSESTDKQRKWRLSSELEAAVGEVNIEDRNFREDNPTRHSCTMQGRIIKVLTPLLVPIGSHIDRWMACTCIGCTTLMHHLPS